MIKSDLLLSKGCNPIVNNFMSNVRRTRNGKAVSPYHASRRYAAQNKKGTHKVMGADGKLVEKKLTKSEKAWRAGYTTATGDAANKYKEVNAIADAFAIPGKGGAKAHVKKIIKHYYLSV